MPDGLYERDALAWSDQQADLLRRIVAGKRLNANVDWANVVSEVQDVGLPELRACRSLLQQAMVQLFKLHAWPLSRAAGHWRAEAGIFLDDAAQRFTPSMRQRFGLDGLYAKALRRAREATDDAGEPQQLPAACPFALDELLDGELAVLAARLSAGREAPSSAPPPETPA